MRIKRIGKKKIGKKNGSDDLDGKEKFLKIPFYLLEDDNLNLLEVFILAEVIALHDMKGCTVTNGRLGDLLGYSSRQISTTIHSLAEKGYIKIDYPAKTKRVIVPMEKTSIEKISIENTSNHYRKNFHSTIENISNHYGNNFHTRRRNTNHYAYKLQGVITYERIRALGSS